MGTGISRFASSLLLACLAGTSSSHHAIAPHFDPSKEVVIEDVVITEFKLVNPHAYIYFDAPNSDGATSSWRCELSAATMLRRRGWSSDTLLPGQTVTIKGLPARREDNVCAAEAIVFADGTEIKTITDLAVKDAGQGKAESSVWEMRLIALTDSRMGNPI